MQEVEEAKENAIAKAVAKTKVEAEGMKNGLEKGMENAHLEMARQLKLNGVPTDVIERL